MKEVAELLNSMVANGVIADYAIFGAVAQMRYTEAVSTMDASVLVALPLDAGLDLLRPIYAYCEQRGYEPEGEAIRVGDWPVQFIPPLNTLTEEAMREADVDEMDGVPLRVVRADHLAVIALEVGRAKDSARILALLDSGAVTIDEIARLAARHNLETAWTRFRRRFFDD